MGQELHDFTTIREEVEHEIVIEKSRFITTLHPVTTEEEAMQFIQQMKKKYWDARHNCSAFTIGPRQEQQRSSDDGEPSGTAGKPMLEVLKKTGITNVVAVVTRYFGGIKLGAGGLIRAYAGSVSEAIQRAPKDLHAVRAVLVGDVPYPFYGAIERYLQEEQLVYTSDFSEAVRISILIPPDEIDNRQKALQNLTNGSVSWEEHDSRMTVIPV